MGLMIGRVLLDVTSILKGLGACIKPKTPSTVSRDKSSPAGADILKFCTIALRKRNSSIFAKDFPIQLRLPENLNKYTVIR